MSRSSSSARLFFALLPDKPARLAIEQHVAQLSPEAGRKVTPDNWHITLHFLGEVPLDKIDVLGLDCDAISHPAFTLNIDRSSWWQKAATFWLGPSESPPPLLGLVRQLSSSAAKRKLTMEKRKYIPHVTLMRGVYDPPQGVIVRPFEWQAREFCLMQSENTSEGVKYRKLESWPLRSL